MTLGKGRFVAAACFGASEFKGLLAAGRDVTAATGFFAGAVVPVLPTSINTKMLMMILRIETF